MFHTNSKLKVFLTTAMSCTLVFGVFAPAAHAATISDSEAEKFLEELSDCPAKHEDYNPYDYKFRNNLNYYYNITGEKTNEDGQTYYTFSDPVFVSVSQKEINSAINEVKTYREVCKHEYNPNFVSDLFDAAKADQSYDGTDNYMCFDRLAGNTAFGTMKKIVDEGWDTTDWAIVATSNSYHDALSASGLAGLLNCPILLTGKDELNNTTKNILTSKKVKNVIVVGGTAAVSDNVKNQIKKLGVSVERVAGNTAIGTANKIYEYGKKVNGGWGKDAIVATSSSFQDALSIAPYAYAKKVPIFLASGKPGTLTDTTAKNIKNNGFTRTIITGGTQAVAESVESQVKTKTVKRLGGGTAYGTSKKIADFCISEGMSAKHMGVATASSYYDALCAGPFIGKQNSVLVVSDSGTFKNSNIKKSQSLTNFLNNHRKEIVPSILHYTEFEIGTWGGDNADELNKHSAEMNKKIEELKNGENKYKVSYIGLTDPELGQDSDKEYFLYPTKYNQNYIFGGVNALPSDTITGIGKWQENSYENTKFSAEFCKDCAKLYFNTPNASYATINNIHSVAGWYYSSGQPINVDNVAYSEIHS